MKKFSKSFYQKDTIEIAKRLLGCLLVTNIDGKITGGKIVETEVYLGQIDKASHAYPSKLTPRTKIQFASGGVAYIYLVYGLYYQFCVVTNKKNIPDVVLIRALEPLIGIKEMKKRRRVRKLKDISNGPGKLCQALKITKMLYGESLIGNKIWITPSPRKIPEKNIIYAKRIGIDYAKEFKHKLWRFFIKGNQFVSRT